MWRAFLLAIGVILLVLGIECSMLDHIYIRPSAMEHSFDQGSTTVGQAWTPPGWASYLLLLGGSVVVLGSCRPRSRREMVPAASLEIPGEETAVPFQATLLDEDRESTGHPGGNIDGFFDFDEEDFFDEDQ